MIMSNWIPILVILFLMTKHSQSQEELNKQRGHHDKVVDKSISTGHHCPDVQNPNNKTHIMVPHLFPQAYWSCCLGNPGCKLTGPCKQEQPNTTQVERCKEGTYISEFAHFRRECDVDDLVCLDPFIKIPSNITQAPQCVCEDDFFVNKNNGCTPYSKCGPGWGVFIHGNPYNDTQCEQCKRGFHSPSSSSSERCLLNSSLTTINTSSSSGNSSMPIHPSEETKKFPPSCDLPAEKISDGWIGGGTVITILITSVFWMVLIVYFPDSTNEIREFLSKFLPHCNRNVDSQAPRYDHADNGGESRDAFVKCENDAEENHPRDSGKLRET